MDRASVLARLGRFQEALVGFQEGTIRFVRLGQNIERPAA